jgi:hypothetical protein
LSSSDSEPKPKPKPNDKIHKYFIWDFDFLSDSSLQIAFIKTHFNENEDKEAIKRDASRVGVRELLDQVFNKSQESKTPSFSFIEKRAASKPLLVLCAEYVFSSNDFDFLKGHLENFKGEIIFIGGFGAVSGKRLKELSQDTIVHKPWDNDLEIDSSLKYNAGWLWVKHEKELRCYIFLKNFLEQGFEAVSIESIHKFIRIVRFETKDLIIYPLICADLVTQKDQKPLETIKKDIEKISSQKKILVTASLLQKKPNHKLWDKAFKDLFSSDNKLRDTCALVLNNGYQVNYYDYLNSKDLSLERENRCLTGVLVNYNSGNLDTGVGIKTRKEEHCYFANFIRSQEEGYMQGDLHLPESIGAGKDRHSFSLLHRHIWQKIEGQKQLLQASTNNNYLELMHLLNILKPSLIKEDLELNDKVFTSELVSGIKKENENLMNALKIAVGDNDDRASDYVAKIEEASLKGFSSVEVESFFSDIELLRNLHSALCQNLFLKHILDISDFNDFNPFLLKLVDEDKLDIDICIWSNTALKLSSMRECLSKMVTNTAQARDIHYIVEGSFKMSIDSELIDPDNITEPKLEPDIAADSLDPTKPKSRRIYFQPYDKFNSKVGKPSSLEDLKTSIKKIFEVVWVKENE